MWQWVKRPKWVSVHDSVSPLPIQLSANDMEMHQRLAQDFGLLYACENPEEALGSQLCTTSLWLLWHLGSENRKKILCLSYSLSLTLFFSTPHNSAFQVSK